MNTPYPPSNPGFPSPSPPSWGSPPIGPAYITSSPLSQPSQSYFLDQYSTYPPSTLNGYIGQRSAPPQNDLPSDADALLALTVELPAEYATARRPSQDRYLGGSRTNSDQAPSSQITISDFIRVYILGGLLGALENHALVIECALGLKVRHNSLNRPPSLHTLISVFFMFSEYVCFYKRLIT